MRPADMDVDVRRMAEDGFSLVELWVLAPGEEPPPEARTSPTEWEGVRLAFRVRRDGDGMEDSGDEIPAVA